MTDSSVRPDPLLVNGLYLGLHTGPLAANGFTPGRRVVDWACPKPETARIYELGVEVERTGDAAGRFESLDVQFRSGGRRGELFVPLSIVLCPRADTKSGDCQLVLSGGG